MYITKILFSRRKGSSIYIDQFGTKTVHDQEPLKLVKTQGVPSYLVIGQQQITLDQVFNNLQKTFLYISQANLKKLNLIEQSKSLFDQRISTFNKTYDQIDKKLTKLKQIRNKNLLQCSVLLTQLAKLKKSSQLQFDMGSKLSKILCNKKIIQIGFNKQLVWECLKLWSSNKISLDKSNVDQMHKIDRFLNKKEQGMHKNVVNIILQLMQEKQQHDHRKLQQLTNTELINKLQTLRHINSSLKNRLIQYQKYKDHKKHIKSRSQIKSAALFQKFTQKKFAVMIAYIGIGYNGFAIQFKHDKNTIQHYLFKSLISLNLIKDSSDCDYTRAARTDAGVSAFGNVVSLNMRTNIPKNKQEQNGKQIRYVQILNALLPKDIRILSVFQIDQLQFSARYRCKQRAYKYFFTKGYLNIDVMSQAITKFKGKHDFRNFCKVDLTNAVQFQRSIYQAQIQHVEQNKQDSRLSVYCFYLHANSFLWHQIRFIASILFIIGSGKQDPSIIDDLLDIRKTIRKPNYPISQNYPLVLQKCFFPDYDFRCQDNHAVQVYSSFHQIVSQKIIQLTIFTTTMKQVASVMLDPNLYKLSNDAYQKDIQIFKKNKRKKNFIICKSTCLTIDQSALKLQGKKKQIYQYKTKKKQQYELKKKQQSIKNQ